MAAFFSSQSHNPPTFSKQVKYLPYSKSGQLIVDLLVVICYLCKLFDTVIFFVLSGAHVKLDCAVSSWSSHTWTHFEREGWVTTDILLDLTTNYLVNLLTFLKDIPFQSNNKRHLQI
jgi:hypothetical protein